MSRRTRAPVAELYGAAAIRANRPKPADPEQALRELLADAGVQPQALNEILDAVDDLVDVLAVRRAGEAIVRLAAVLPVTKEGLALQRVLLAGKAPTLRTAARACGCGYMAIWRAEHAIRKALRRDKQP